jgi:hypothetical protein
VISTKIVKKLSASPQINQDLDFLDWDKVQRRTRFVKAIGIGT